MSYRASIDNHGKDGIPPEGRDEFTAIPTKRIGEYYWQSSIRTFPLPHRRH
jgi:hypothetical protein